ncbi:hypothetical protein DFH07DRAFT_489735 [Mycena maculata]|uniref:GIY-YIG domain-containing protein n=1 Tax=Mycena maculata TaxID=230809 RepID=A0AAD7J505_9AGAR|nr:hypothetical protein DFH07DRAFT_489735 [Mycena maculata]
MRQPSARSSLFSHSFPSFYACYLLKSIQTPTSTATYIGSTPNPPKRIRQHNGQLTQGAHKTRLRRPWVMQMIVYGFPSKLAALQFEWAWQHAHISRHLKDADGKSVLRRSNTVTGNIRTVRLMLSTHPWRTWPLHVKLFTDAAVKGWKLADAQPGTSPLPRGFNWTVELEGVDGKSGQDGSGRHGPISVDDAMFTSAHLAKNTALLASNRRLNCSVCNEDLHNYSTDHLKMTLCPATGCTAVSHLSCLSEDFLASQTSATGMIPRGGQCRSCGGYVLWGDIVRGMYRRSAGGAILEPEGNNDDLFLSDIDEPEAPPKSAKAKGKATATASPQPKRGRPRLVQDPESSEGEAFDFNVSSSSDSELPSPPKRGRPRKASPVALSPGPSPRKRAKVQDAPAHPPKKRAAKLSASSSPPKRGAKLSPKKYHTLAGAPPPTVVDSSDFFDSDSFGDLGNKIAPLDYREPRRSNLGPEPARKLVLRPGEVDFFDETRGDALSRAMSVLSVADGSEVIVLSDY